MDEKTLPRSDKIKKYSSLKTKIVLFSVAASLFFTAVFLFLLSDIFFNFLSECFKNTAAIYAVYILGFIIFTGILALPLHFVSSFLVEKKYGLTSMSFAAWALDEIKLSLLNLIFSMAAIGFFYVVTFYFPMSWWLLSAFAWIVFSVVMSYLAPVVIIPLFLKYLPIGSSGMENMIRELAAKTGVNIAGVSRVDLSRRTLKANAALVGMRGTRKVILADTLMDNFTLDEVEMVVAHEFGHHKYGHSRKLIIFSSVSAFLGLLTLFLISGFVASLAGTRGIYDVRTLPVIFFLVSIFDVGILPFKNLFSRYLEREADSFALDVTGSPDVFARMMEKLAAMNFADTEPSFLKKIFLYSHPPISERITAAKSRMPGMQAGTS